MYGPLGRMTLTRKGRILDNMTAIALTASLLTITWVSSYIGLFRRSFTERLPGSELRAVYQRRSLLAWDLSIAPPGATAGIRQGTMSLPTAKRLARDIAAGQRSII